MRRAFVLFVLALLAVSPVPARAVLGGDPAPAALSPELVTALSEAAPDARLGVYVHAVDDASSRSAVAAAGARLAYVFEGMGVSAAFATPAQVAALQGSPGVTYLEGAQKLVPLTTTSHTATRGLGLTTSAGDAIDGSGFSVAIVDTGVDGSHPAIADNMARNFKVVCPFYICDENDGFLNAGTDQYTEEAQFVDVGANGNSETPGEGGHGTHVASTAAGKLGAAGNANIVAFGVSAGSFYGSDAALHWLVRHGADPCGDGSCPPVVSVNNSYGPPGGGTYNPNSIRSKLQDKLVAQNVTVVWAAGNDGNRGNANATNPPGQSPTPGVVMVAAYDDRDEGSRDASLAAFSSRGLRYGLRKDAAGNVVDTRNTYPDISAPGTRITAACRPTTPTCGATTDDPDSGTISGTSMAAPHVAGIVAQLHQAHEASGRAGALSPAAVERVLEDTAHRFTAGARYEPDPFNGGSATSYDKGHGLVDVAAAVAALGGPAAALSPPLECAVDDADLRDLKGDTTFLLTANTEPYSPGLDIRDGSIAWDAARGEVVYDVVLEQVDATPPTTDVTQFFQLRFEHDGRRFEAEVRRNLAITTTVILRDADAKAPYTLPEGTPPLRAAFEPGSPGHLVVSIPAATIAAAAPTLRAVTTGTEMGELEIVTGRLLGGVAAGGRTVGGLIALADDASGRCPVTLMSSAVLTATRTDFRNTTTIVATLTDAATGQALAGRTIDFMVDGEVVGTAMTTPTGKAQFSIRRLSPKQVVTVSFAGGGGYRSATATAT